MGISYPPGPRDWTFGLSTIRRMKADLLGYYQELKDTYGDFVHIRLGPFHYYAAFHPETIRDILVTQSNHLPIYSRMQKVLSQWNGKGLLTSQGDYWKQQRRRVQKAFTVDRLRNYADVIVRQSEVLADTLPNREIDVFDAMTELTLDIITETMFGSELSKQAIMDVGKAVSILSHIAVTEMSAPITLPDWFPLPIKRQKKWAMRTLDSTIWKFISRWRESGKDKGDLLSMLMLAVDEEGDGKAMTDEQVRNECMTLFIAGHDTSASGLAWMLFNLARNPEVVERICEEGRSLPMDRSLGFEDLKQLPYTEAAIKESLRFHSPAIGVFQRHAQKDLEIGGYTIPKGSIVQPFSFFTHRDPRWFPNPDTFDPERFLGERGDAIPQFAYFPFGGGPRACIGKRFAMIEMTLVVATLLRRLKPHLLSNPDDVVLEAEMSLRSKTPIILGWTEE